jgi:hypothetical protein
MSEISGGKVLVTEIKGQYEEGLGWVNSVDFYNDQVGFGTVKESVLPNDQDQLCTRVDFTDLDQVHYDRVLEFASADKAREIARTAIAALDI